MSGTQHLEALTRAVTEKLSGGQVVKIRPLERGDIELQRQFLSALSPDALHFRFHAGIGKPSQKMLEQLTDIDHAEREAFIALIDGEGGETAIGESRYALDPDGESGECAVVVTDAWQRQGLGTLLLNRLIESARARGIARLYSMDAADNLALNAFAQKHGWECHYDPDDHTQVIYSLDLTAG
ncbi:GNAT family N-acetyltransferase [Microbulbifer magnicolonia]|uniref:GNAT family N-acetyltransferase n=1 Tax=Microbulbifer magnicolonia TaxID=3109744 RepID=UPI002B405BE2|nr:GNAT family N-acetyltransferase [Microbulbifer sp. GG15]